MRKYLICAALGLIALALYVNRSQPAALEAAGLVGRGPKAPIQKAATKESGPERVTVTLSLDTSVTATPTKQ